MQEPDDDTEHDVMPERFAKSKHTAPISAQAEHLSEITIEQLEEVEELSEPPTVAPEEYVRPRADRTAPSPSVTPKRTSASPETLATSWHPATGTWSSHSQPL
ncbi:hypothetical protein MPC38_02890 [Prescottella equi]|uniref:hypothetical protein n=1 Tax=Rhodococcus hoagii TaxID=43767 RepID=UPI001F5B8D90|nr:hypothetical protein [Prescottella equi]UNQ40228.1 hypothetical protein MPC38_02890 [Prescottella equi]